jgi:hypothetical protein
MTRICNRCRHRVPHPKGLRRLRRRAPCTCARGPGSTCSRAGALGAAAAGARATQLEVSAAVKRAGPLREGGRDGEGVRGAGEWLRMSGRRGNGYSCLGAGGQSMAEHGCWAAAPFVLSPGRFCRIHRESNQPALSDQRFLGGLSSFRIEAQMHNEIRWRSACSPD